MNKQKILPKCDQHRLDCFSCDETGHCHCLNSTIFRKANGSKYKCPFYKTKEEVGVNLINIEEDDSDENSAS